MSALVLVVDDDDAIRDMLQSVLEDEGYVVSLARHGLEALQRIMERPPSVILLDLQMPVMTGYELHDALKAQGAAIPVVYMSAGTIVRSEAERRHADGYIAKPFSLDDLVGTVARFVA